KPNPLLKEEARFILKQMGMSERIVDFDVELGEVVKIIDGPFNNQIGSIDQIDEELFKLTVLVELFGRETPVEVEYDQVEKIDKYFIEKKIEVCYYKMVAKMRPSFYIKDMSGRMKLLAYCEHITRMRKLTSWLKKLSTLLNYKSQQVKQLLHHQWNQH